MIGTILLRGMLMGVLAGLLAVGFAEIFGEPSINRSIAFESAAYHAAGQAEEPEIVSRAVQSTIGLGTAAVLFGAATGGLFALVFAYANGRAGRLGPRMVSGLLGISAFLAVTLVPFFKYPANPPAIGEPETIGLRTALFFSMMALSIIAMIVSVMVGRGLGARLGSWNAGLAGAVCFIALTGVAGALLPAVNEVPEAFPAVVLWQFRVASLGMHAILWTTLGLGLGAWTEAAGRSSVGAGTKKTARPA